MKERVGARDAHKHGKENTEREEADADPEGCPVLEPSSTARAASCVSQQLAHVCWGRFRIMCGHFTYFLPSACLQVTHRPVNHRRPKATRGINVTSASSLISGEEWEDQRGQ